MYTDGFFFVTFIHSLPSELRHRIEARLLLINIDILLLAVLIDILIEEWRKEVNHRTTVIGSKSISTINFEI